MSGRMESYSPSWSSSESTNVGSPSESSNVGSSSESTNVGEEERKKAAVEFEFEQQPDPMRCEEPWMAFMLSCEAEEEESVVNVVMEASDLEKAHSVSRVLAMGAFGKAPSSVTIVTHRQTRKKFSVTKHPNADENVYYAQLLLQLRCPCILRPHQILRIGHELHLVFDHFEATMATFIEENTDKFHCKKDYAQPEPGKVRRWLFQALLAIAYLHKKDLVHRNITPAAFVLDTVDPHAWNANVKLTDFTLTCHCAEGTQLTQPVGILEYSAPEMFKGTYGKSCDLWSLGVTMYHLCVGEPPFGQRSSINAGDSKRLRSSVLGCRQINFAPQKWSRQFPELRQVVEKLLTRGVSARPSASRLLSTEAILQKEAQKQSGGGGSDSMGCCVVS